MGFSINRNEENGFYVITLKDNVNNTQVDIVPNYGAMLHGFKIQHDGKPLNLIDNYESLDQYTEEVTTSFKSVKLSPFACRLKDSSYTWDGIEYNIEKSPIHGLLFDANFEVIEEEITARYVSITLEYEYNAEDPGYPFPFTVHVHYKLMPRNELKVITRVTNRHTGPIPVMDGWHPYFTTGTPVDQLELQFASNEIVEFDNSLIPTGRLVRYNTFKKLTSLTGVNMDNSYTLNFIQPQPLCRLYDPVKGITIALSPEESYPILQVYIPPHRNSIAIENLSAPPDAFNNGMMLKRLGAGKSTDFVTTVKVN
ncbi:aldose 1-epimerase [Chitinophaga sedimenti]|uniref:aldose 1-epimerase n=1 Tax=Chitinophaga sedimenti TaxID=2033606 RepID=UPI002005C1A5|nr:aldose 1-epimerase [Chitinophaga sedimenti]MCK7560182.1 aldose 1-epimerase [Chitinophaga sedimenti]